MGMGFGDKTKDNSKWGSIAGAILGNNQNMKEALKNVIDHLNYK